MNHVDVKKKPSKDELLELAGRLAITCECTLHGGLANLSKNLDAMRLALNSYNAAIQAAGPKRKAKK